ncbi:hypothetical protein ACLMYS_003884 [Salmonella enterica]
MAILVQDGRIAVATAILKQPIHLAWGSGNPAWDSKANPDDPSTTQTGLIKEIARRKANQVQYCERVSSNGSIFVNKDQFNLTTTPTNFLYIRVAFEYADAAGEAIRELGVFVGTQFLNTPASPDYFLPGDIDPANPGQLLVVENIQKLQRSQDIRQQFEFVIQF